MKSFERRRKYSKVISSHQFKSEQLSENSDFTISSPYELFGATFNFVNSIVGAGIIGIPYAIKECGFIMGIILIASIAYCINSSVRMLISTGIKENKYNFEELSYHLFGKVGYNAVIISMFTFAYGALIAYMVIVGDTLPHVIAYILNTSVNRELVMLCTASFVMLPICLLRDLSSLSSTSFLSILADVILLLLIACNGPQVAKNTSTTYQSPEDNTIITYSIFAGIGTISFAFVCQHNSFMIYNSLPKPNYINMMRVTQASLVIALCLCMGLGVAGYLSFGSHTLGDILNNFPEENHVMVGGRSLLAVSMICTYPMEVYVARHCIHSILRSYKFACVTPNLPLQTHHCHETSSVNETNVNALNAAVVIDVSNDKDEYTTYERMPHVTNVTNTDEDGMVKDPTDLTKSPLCLHVMITLALWTSTVLIAVLCKDLAVVCALTGAVAASMLGFILPASLYLKSNEVELKQVLSRIKSLRRDGSMATFKHRYLTMDGEDNVQLVQLGPNAIGSDGDITMKGRGNNMLFTIEDEDDRWVNEGVSGIYPIEEGKVEVEPSTEGSGVIHSSGNNIGYNGRSSHDSGGNTLSASSIPMTTNNNIFHQKDTNTIKYEEEEEEVGNYNDVSDSISHDVDRIRHDKDKDKDRDTDTTGGLQFQHIGLRSLTKVSDGNDNHLGGMHGRSSNDNHFKGHLSICACSRGSDVKRSIILFYPFLLPCFLIVFGVFALAVGVSTVIYNVVME